MYSACSDCVGFVALGESTTRGLWVTLSCEGLEGASQRFIIDGNARASRTAFLARRSGIQDDIASCIRDHLQQFKVTNAARTSSHSYAIYPQCHCDLL